RRTVRDASTAKIKQYALEGEKEIAAIPIPGQAQPLQVKGVVRFHIRGRQPTSVTMYLRAQELSPLHYTELGHHDHSLTVSGGTGTPVDAAGHPTLTSTTTSHFHAAGRDPNEGDPNFNLIASDFAAQIDSAHTNHQLFARKGYIGQNYDNQTGRYAGENN